MSKRKQPAKRSKTKFYIITGIIIIGIAGVYSVINSMTPVNGSTPIFGLGENIFLNAKHTEQGFVYAFQSGGKKSIGTTQISPPIHLTKGQLATIRFMNNDKDYKHNINIDEFNVHSKDLGYFEPQAITFIADKTGTFHYHCTLHPEMVGDITVQ